MPDGAGNMPRAPQRLRERFRYNLRTVVWLCVRPNLAWRPSRLYRRRRNLSVTLVVRGENAGKKYRECGAALIGSDRVTR